MNHSVDNKAELSQVLSSIINTAIDGIITIDSKGYILSCNKAGCQLFEYEEDELIGEKINILMNSKDQRNHDSYLYNYLTTHVPKIIGIGREVVGRKKDGKLFSLRLAVSEVLLNDRVIFTGILHDLSEIKKAQDEILSLNAALEEKVSERTNQLEEAINRLLKTNELLRVNEEELKSSLEKEKELNLLKTRFVQMASHEFRTPLSTILSSASLISKYIHENEQTNRDKHVDRIKSAVTNLTAILNDFLSLSRLEEGQILSSPEVINFDELCTTIQKELDVILKKGQRLIARHIGDATINTDSKILKNIMFNLISNAIKYSGENTNIECNSTITSVGLNVQIKDQGQGIPPEEQKYLFERFFRATNAENIQGTGLGLSIVKSYLNILNGEIYFESTLGKGSSFTFTIPNAKM